MEKLWNDPVWSKVIATGVITIPPAVWGAVRKLRKTRQIEALSYAGIVGKGSFLLMGWQWHFQVVQIVNSRTDIPTVVNNTRAIIEYRHADGEVFVVSNALWLTVAHQTEFTDKVQLSSGKTALLCLMAQEPNKTDTPFTVITNVSQVSTNKALKAGAWKVKISISSDNLPVFVGTGGFTILADNRLAYNEPMALTFKTSQ